MKTVAEILKDAAQALRDNGHECRTVQGFWECKCPGIGTIIHTRDEVVCGECKAVPERQPDARLCDVLESLVDLDLIN